MDVMNIPQEIIEKILLYCDYDTVNNCRDLQTTYFKTITKNKDLSNCENLENVKWLLKHDYDKHIDMSRVSDKVLKYLLNNNYIKIKMNDISVLASEGRFEMVFYTLSFMSNYDEAILFNGFLLFACKNNDFSILDFYKCSFKVVINFESYLIVKSYKMVDKFFSYLKSD